MADQPSKKDASADATAEKAYADAAGSVKPKAEADKAAPAAAAQEKPAAKAAPAKAEPAKAEPAKKAPAKKATAKKAPAKSVKPKAPAPVAPKKGARCSRSQGPPSQPRRRQSLHPPRLLRIPSPPYPALPPASPN